MRFLAGLLLAGTLAWGTIAPVQVVNGTSSSCSAGACTLTVAATTAGNLGVVFLSATNTSTKISSVSGGGTWVANGACKTTSSAQAADLAYITSLTGGVTSLTITASNTYVNAVSFAEYSASGTWSFESCTLLANQSSTSHPTSPSVTTTGTSDLIVTVLATTGMHYGNTTVTGAGWTTPCPILLPGPALTNAQSAGDHALNVAPGSYQATFTGYSGGATFGAAAIVFSVTGGAGTTFVPQMPIWIQEEM
jgi:hypothetical protein